MAQPPDPGYRFWSDDSTRGVALEEMREEIRREHDRRREVYPGLVHNGRLTELDAAAEISMMAAIADEFAWELERGRRGIHAAGSPPLNSYRYHQKIACLRREIEIRRNTYPRLIAARRATHEDCQRHLSAIEGAHAWYWHHGLDLMEGSRDHRPHPAPGDCAWNIRAEIARREAWAIAHGYDIAGPAYCAGIFDGDWNAVPRLEEKAA